MDGLEAYRETAVATQTNGRLIVMLYDGAIRTLRLAATALEAQDWARKGEHINKAAAIIEELDVCLDMEAGGEVAFNLRRLYVFMLRHLNQANVRRDAGMVREVIALLEELNEGWRVVTA